MKAVSLIASNTMKHPSKFFSSFRRFKSMNSCFSSSNSRNIHHSPFQVTQKVSTNFGQSGNSKFNANFNGISSGIRDFSTLVKTRVERAEKDIDSLSEDESKENLNKREESPIEREAWKLLQDSVVQYCGHPVGTLAANDPSDSTPLNYDQVFIRDFVPSALAFLLKGEEEIVKNLLLHTLQLQVIMNEYCLINCGCICPK